jgi:Peptidase family M28
MKQTRSSGIASQPVADGYQYSVGYAWFVLVIFVVMGAGFERMIVPAMPVDNAPLDRFSSSRAYSELSDLLKENIPHPAGSEANRLIRDRIKNKMINYGFSVDVQKSFACVAEAADCSRVENIVAYKKGRVGKYTVMIMSHYDSVPASAGAADDGVGVAAMLEVARILNDAGSYDNDFIFLFSDAEELGLNGAEAFASEHALMNQVSMIVNIESRGTSGPSYMFETGSPNLALIDIYQNAIKRPLANSLFYEVYKRMPNDTDYTVFKSRNVPGLNFGSSGSPSLYHSKLDDLQHLDKGTLQQHGDNVASLIQALGNADLSTLSSSKENATYFDVFGVVLLKWSSNLNVPISLLGLALIFVIVGGGVRTRTITVKSIALSISSALLVSITLIGAGALLTLPLGIWVDLHPLDHINPWAGNIALWSASLLAVVLVGRLTFRLTNFTSQLFVSWLLIGVVSLILAYKLPGCTYFVLAPLVAFMVGLVTDIFRAQVKNTPIDFLVAANAGFVVSVYMGYYHFHILTVLFNFQFSALKVMPFLVIAISLLPLSQAYYAKYGQVWKRHIVIIGAAIAVACAVSMQVPGFSIDRPEGFNIVYHEDWDNKKAYWTLDLQERDADLQQYNLMGFTAQEEQFQLYGMFDVTQRRKSTQYQSLNPPVFDLHSDTIVNGKRLIEASVRAGRDGYSVYLKFDSNTALESIEVNGDNAMPRDSRWLAERGLVSLGATQQGEYHLKLIFGNSDHVALTLMEVADLEDTTEAQALVSSRPIHANEVHDGDKSVVFRKLTL